MGKSCGGARCSEPGWAQDRQDKSFILLIYIPCLTSKVRSGEARCGPELDGETLWRRQVFGARMGARKERKVFFIGIQRGHLTSKVRSGEVRFGSELDEEKLWRGQVFGQMGCTLTHGLTEEASPTSLGQASGHALMLKSYNFRQQMPKKHQKTVFLSGCFMIFLGQMPFR